MPDDEELAPDPTEDQTSKVKGANKHLEQHRGTHGSRHIAHASKKKGPHERVPGGKKIKQLFRGSS